MSLGGREGPAAARPRVRRHLGRALQQHRLGGDAAALPGAVGGLFEAGGDVLVRPVGGLGGVPGAPVGVEDRVRDVGQRRCTARRSSGVAPW
ncbi:hypothetical protein [Streptomyces sp. KL116D]|uniref:hypothetical protein n=1 Tax=Streptomyces sp. KL116D TaxID=3045152 RepID=UPI003558F231